MPDEAISHIHWEEIQTVVQLVRVSIIVEAGDCFG